MPQNEVNQYNEVDNDNTDITGTTVVQGQMYPPMVDDAFRKLMGALKRTFRTDLFRLRDNTNQTKQVAFALSGLTTATTRTLTVQDRNGTIALTNSTDTRRNRVVNHDMRVSQENGTTSGTGNGFYPVDQWAQYFVTSAGVLTVQQVASATPAGSPNRLRATVTTPDTSLAAGEYWVLSQNIEGSNVADFRYGSASAVASVLRFGFRGPAGTYAAHLGNSAGNRSYVAMFTIAGGQANTDTVQTFAIPGDTTGTWLTADGVIGLTLDVVLAAGSALRGVTGWQAGNILATSAISNGMGTGGAVFDLFDVGLRLDPDATGVYGQYEVGEKHPDYRSERYALRLQSVPLGRAQSAQHLFAGGATGLAVPMAKTPSLLPGATFDRNTGIAGTPGLGVVAAQLPTASFLTFYNTASNWTPDAFIAVNGVVSARLS